MMRLPGYKVLELVVSWGGKHVHPGYQEGTENLLNFVKNCFVQFVVPWVY